MNDKIFQAILSNDKQIYSYTVPTLVSFINSLDKNKTYPEILFINYTTILHKFIRRNCNKQIDDNWTDIFNIYNIYKPDTIPFFTELNSKHMIKLLQLIDKKIYIEVISEVFEFRISKYHKKPALYEIVKKLNKEYNNKSVDVEQIKYILQNCVFVQSDINHLIKHFYKNINFKFFFMIILDNIVINDDTVSHIFAYTINLDFYDIIDKIVNNYEYEILSEHKCLEYACLHSKRDRIMFALGYKLKPTNKCLEYRYEYNIEYINQTCKSNTDVKLKNILNNDIFYIFELFIKYGFVPDYDTVKIFADFGIELPNIDRFNIVLDYNIYKRFLFNNKKYKPSNYKFVMNLDETFNQIIMSKADINTYKKFFKKNKEFIIKQEHMHDICDYTQSQKLLSLLVDNGAIIDFKCIENLTRNISRTKLFFDGLIFYEEQFNTEIEKD